MVRTLPDFPKREASSSPAISAMPRAAIGVGSGKRCEVVRTDDVLGGPHHRFFIHGIGVVAIHSGPETAGRYRLGRCDIDMSLPWRSAVRESRPAPPRRKLRGWTGEVRHSARPPDCAPVSGCPIALKQPAPAREPRHRCGPILAAGCLRRSTASGIRQVCLAPSANRAGPASRETPSHRRPA